LRKLETPRDSTPNGMPLPLAFSSDSKLLATGMDNGKDPMSKGNLQLWEVATGASLHTLEFPHQVASVAFSPDGKTLAVGTWGATLHLWDIVAAKERLKLDRRMEGWGGITALAFSPDGKTLAVGNVFCLLEVSTGRELHKLTSPTNQVLSLAFSPNGRWLASANSDQTVRLWEVTAGLMSECYQFRGHDAGVSAVAFSPDGLRLASGSGDSTALVWDVTGLAGKQARAPRLTDEEQAALWKALMNTEATRAFPALRTLAATPEQAVPFLAKQLHRKRTDPAQIARLLADLDNDEFRVRKQATKELEKLGDEVEPALRRALKDKPSIEVRRRIEQILETIAPPGVSPLLLRWLRVVEVLEWIGNPAARELL
jgi:dipeptidyl aminopeptidase/acylaminoacyl peptidase